MKRMIRAVRDHGILGTLFRALRLSRDLVVGERPLRTPDRHVLERVILPHYRRCRNVTRVLFVGCERYTAHYSKYFRDKQFWTIEPDPDKRKYGATRHVVDVLQNLHRHFPPGSFDLIICNGVFGWGLNDRADCEEAFDHCFTTLVDGGELVIGWNDTPEYRPFELAELRSLGQFESMSFSPLGTSRYLCDAQMRRHVYSFYRKPQ